LLPPIRSQEIRKEIIKECREAHDRRMVDVLFRAWLYYIDTRVSSRRALGPHANSQSK